jgi:hypothetical protein
MSASHLSCAETQFEIRFASLLSPGGGLSFPCDEQGCVLLDALPTRVMNDYLFARAMVGKDFLPPCVCHPDRAAL